MVLLYVSKTKNCWLTMVEPNGYARLCGAKQQVAPGERKNENYKRTKYSPRQKTETDTSLAYF